MAKIDKVQEVAIADLKPYDKNAKVHSDEQVDMICNSIEEFGFISPCLIDKDNRIIAGHGRVMAAKKLGLKNVPCVYIEGLTEEQYKAYILVDNKLTTSSARKAYKHLEVGKRIEVWNNNQIVEKIRFSDTRQEKNPLAPYIELEREYIRKKQKKAELRNRRRREYGKANQPC